MRSYNYIFGPVPSRRLGLSLGVDIIPRKLCTLDCIYCEVGKTDKRGLARKEYYSSQDILAEVKQAIAEHSHLDHITISGSGEPTLNSKIGEIIHSIKDLTPVPVAVLTNGTLLFLPDVRRDLLEANIVSPSLDAISTEIFEKIDRPHPQLRIDQIVEGLVQFRQEYTGILWLEILFVKDLNDSDTEVKFLKKAIDMINPDKIHLNTVKRPPTEKFAKPVSEKRLKEIQNILGVKSEIIGIFKDRHVTEDRTVDSQAILALLRRRAMTVEGLKDSLMISEDDLSRSLSTMITAGVIREFSFEGKKFYQTISDKQA